MADSCCCNGPGERPSDLAAALRHEYVQMLGSAPFRHSEKQETWGGGFWDLVQGVGHADGRRHDAPQEAAGGHNVRPVHLVPEDSADRGAERLHTHGCIINLTSTMQGLPAADALTFPEETALVPGPPCPPALR